MSDEDKLEALSQKLDRVLVAVERVANHAIKLDKECIAIGTTLNAIVPELPQIKSSIHRLETALVHVAQDVHDIRDRVLEQDDRLGRRLRVLETSTPSNGKSNGNHG